MRDETVECSVIIPTHHRNDRLQRVLEAYGRQTVPRDRFEIVVVEDGPGGNARAVCESLGARYIDSPHAPGPSGARNLGVRSARSPLVLLTGDDMVPAPDLIARHLSAHAETPDGAVLGRVAWHPDCDVTRFMRYLVERGGQFSFKKIVGPEDCDYRFFYAANISLGTHWLERHPFDERFPYAALEDVELGYRLRRAGLVTRYRPGAVVYHLHQIDLAAYAERMMRVGECMWYFVMKHGEDRSLRGRWLPFTLFPGGTRVITAVGGLLSLLPPSRPKWYGFLARWYARGVARAARRARNLGSPLPEGNPSKGA